MPHSSHFELYMVKDITELCCWRPLYRVSSKQYCWYLCMALQNPDWIMVRIKLQTQKSAVKLNKQINLLCLILLFLTMRFFFLLLEKQIFGCIWTGVYTSLGSCVDLTTLGHSVFLPLADYKQQMLLFGTGHKYNGKNKE